LTVKIQTRPNLSVLALFAFIASFVIARAFTTLYPNTVVMVGGVHIHHLWYGLAMLAVGGWLGISYDDEHVNRLASILFGAGGGIIGDEAGLLLTLGDYWTGLTYTFVIAFLAFAITMILMFKYSRTIIAEFGGFVKSNASFYFGAFTATISVAVILETDNTLVISVATGMVLLAFLTISAYLVQRLRLGH
jgi:hypothetical protein